MTVMTAMTSWNWELIGVLLALIALAIPALWGGIKLVYRSGRIVVLLEQAVQQIFRMQRIQGTALRSHRKVLVQHSRQLEQHATILDDHVSRIHALESARTPAP